MWLSHFLIFYIVIRITLKTNFTSPMKWRFTQRAILSHLFSLLIPNNILLYWTWRGISSYMSLYGCLTISVLLLSLGIGQFIYDIHYKNRTLSSVNIDTVFCNHNKINYIVNVKQLLKNWYIKNNKLILKTFME